MLGGSTVRDPQPGGNGNGRLDPGEAGGLVAFVRNAGTQTAANVRAVLRSSDIRFVVTDSTAGFGSVEPCSTSSNVTDPFAVQVDPAMPAETPVQCTLLLTGDGCNDTLPLLVIVGELRPVDPAPDGPRQPPNYWAYDDADTSYTERPDFSWMEIRGLGTQLSLSDDQTVLVALPTGFVWQYYGMSYSDLSICSNGWVAPGYTSVTARINTALPNPNMPPLIALIWDDFRPTSNGGGVWYYHDQPNHRFIIEFDSVHYFVQPSQWDKFEFVLYDTTVRTPTGDNVIIAQYLTPVSRFSSTIGLQDPTRTVAIQCLRDSTYNRCTAPFTARRAIKYTTVAPPVGVADRRESRVHSEAIRAWPNPFRSSVSLVPGLGLRRSGVRIYDAAGRLVRTLAGRPATWDGRDTAGRRVAPGVYVLRVGVGGDEAETKLVLTR